jgi:hypothetical protein
MKKLLKHLLSVIIAIFACGLVADGQEQTAKSTEAQIPLIQMANVPLSAAIENLALQAEINSTIDPKITDKVWTPVTLRWENVTASEALARLLKERGLFRVENPQTGVIKITTTNSPPRTFDKELFSSLKEVIPMIRMMDVPLNMAFKDLGTKANLKLELDTELSDPSKPFKEQTSVSVKFRNLTAGQALAAICDQYDLQIAKSENAGVWRVSREK